jgi:hypothetical protein
MIKVVNLVAVIIAPIVVQYEGVTGGALVTVWVVALALLGVLGWAVAQSKRPAQSMVEATVNKKG